MIQAFLIFCFSLFLVIKGATLSTRYADKLAKSYHLSKYTVGFIIIAIISILPEAFVSINSSLQGVPDFGLGTLFGSNIADLTLIFAILVFFTGRNLKVESKIIKNHTIYPFILLIPLIFGLNGHFSRIEGLVLVIIGAIFYYTTIKREAGEPIIAYKPKNRWKNFIFLFGSMAILLAGSYFTVNSATLLAEKIGINPVLIGMLIVGLGTTMPELFFSLESLKRNDDSLAIGDLLGTVLADATILVGILALINPFSFPPRIVYVTGVFMVVAAFMLLHFMRSGKTLTKKEAFVLFVFWVIFVLVEFFVNK
ncbi:MAG: sodium:calcium antiporter [Parcubacteria group bacterium]|jgi:cation:H+ antiporter|nr:sodium:calcium antiporter [Parcubacteria group bacterium]